MGSIYKIGNAYYVEFEARGLKYQQLAGDNEAAAWELLMAIEEKIRQGQIDMVARDVPVDIFWMNFIDFARGVYPVATIMRLEKAAIHFRDFLVTRYASIKILSKITPKVIEEYKFVVLHCHAKPWKVNFTLLLLREIFEYAIKAGYLNDNPTLHIRYIADNRKWVAKNKLAHEALAKGVSMFRLAQLLKMNDVLRAMPFFPFVRHPLVES